MKLLLQLLLIGTLGFSGLAQQDVYLHLEGIPGEATAEGHKGQIDVLGWSWGVTNVGLPRSSWSLFNIRKHVDLASVKLMERVPLRTDIPKAILSIQSSDTGWELYRLTFEGVKVASVTISKSSASLPPVEEVKMAFSSIEVRYPIRDARGNLTSTAEADWDLISNTGGSSGNVSFSATLTYMAGAPNAQLTWPSVPGKTYEVLLSTSAEGPFNSFGTYPAGSNVKLSIDVPFHKPRAFFRIRQL